MSGAIERMTELHMQGFHCSQILLIMGLEQRGESNPGLVRSMTGLAGGLGFTGKNCGTLLGGVCLLSLYAGRGEVDEKENHQLTRMIQELVDWFEETFGKEYGGIDCQHIMNNDPWNRLTRCPDVVSKTYLKVQDILEYHELLVVEH